MITVMTVLFAGKAGGQITSLPFGSMERVETYAVSNVYVIDIWSWYFNNTNNTWKPFMTSGWYITLPLTNKLQMDTAIASKLSNILNTLIVHTNQSIRKDSGISVYVDCSMGGNGKSATSFETPNYIDIAPTIVSGVYGIPNLSWFSTTMNDKVPFYIPNLKWARLEIENMDDPNAFEVDDNRIKGSTNVIASDGFMYLPTWAITNSSKLNGDYWLKLSLLSKDFQNFDGDGRLIPETPLRTKIGVGNGSVIVTVSGGDSGRGYCLQNSPDQRSWSSYGSNNFVSPLTHLLPQGDTRSFVYETANNATMFFRTATTNAVPLY